MSHSTILLATLSLPCILYGGSAPPWDLRPSTLLILAVMQSPFGSEDHFEPGMFVYAIHCLRVDRTEGRTDHH
jgi:hypothetical protein